MSKNDREELDVYVIPPNFIEGGKVFGGMFKLRNVIEAGLLGAAVTALVLKIPASLTVKIVVMCLTTLPVAIFGVMGIEGESLTEFLFNVFKFLKNRRTIYRSDVEPDESVSALRVKLKKNKFLDMTVGKAMDISRKRKLKKAEKMKEYKKSGKKVKAAPDIESYLNIEKIENGIIFTKDERYIKILEIEPINFLLRSAREQRNIIFSFVSYLKVSPVKMQFKVLSKKADINKHLSRINEEIKNEENEKCKLLQRDYIRLIKQIGSREAVSRRFFLIFEYEPFKAKEDVTKEKAIFMDELWQLIGASSNKLAANFVFEIFKIIRGYGGSAICATQDLNDFFSLEDGKYGKGIINNAKTKIILNLEEDEAARVQDVLKLSETELMNITHFQRGNGLISTNNNNVTVEFRASDLEKELITTDRAELQAIVERKRNMAQ